MKNGQKRYSTVTTRTKRAKADKDDEIRKELARERKDETEVDLSDIDNIIETDVNGGKSNAIIDIENEKVTSADDNEDDNETKKRRWKHILTKRELWQYRNKSVNGWDRGVWTKELKYITAGKVPAQGNTQAITREKYILFHRTNKTRGCIRSYSDEGIPLI